MLINFLNKKKYCFSKENILSLITIGIVVFFVFFYFYVFAQTPDAPITIRGSQFQVCNGSVSQPASYTGDSPTPTLNWTFTSSNGASSQVSYWVQIDDSGNDAGTYPSPEVNTGEVSSASQSYTVPAGVLEFNTIYYWKVAVKDNFGTWSGWTCADTTFTTNGSSPPDVPTLIAPPNSTWFNRIWINYDPTFQAQVSDPGGDDVRAYFNVLGYGNGWGNWVSSGNISSWGAVSVPDGIYRWRARAYDEYGVWGNYSSYWTLRKDATNPSASLDQPNGVINNTSFTVTLTESDNLSGIDRGDVDVRTDIGPWQDYSNTTSDFTYIGSAGSSYEFRYRVRDNAGNWSSFDYDGSVYINLAPSASNLSVAKGDYCTVPAHYFSWTYSDPENDDENRFRFQVDNNSNFSSPEVNRTVNGSWSDGDSNNQTVVVAVSPSSGQIGYNTTYYWRVRVRDEYGKYSSWVTGPSFTTELHRYPTTDFNWAPQEPSQDEAALFADQSTVYGGATKSSWFWTFENGNPATSNAQNPSVQFTSDGDKQITLQITDSDGYVCLSSKTIGVQIKLPSWKEILPW